jgi:hypothetical protein
MQNCLAGHDEPFVDNLGDEGYRLLGCNTMGLLKELTFQMNVVPPSSG